MASNRRLLSDKERAKHKVRETGPDGRLNLSLVNARLIVVGLTEALADLRKSTGKRPTMEIVID